MPNQLPQAQLLILLVAIALAAFLISLDGFIVNVAIPAMAGELGVREDVGTWIITVFSIASTACVPLAGILTLRYGSARVFVFGVILFAIASFFSGISHNFSLLLLGRVFQGMAAGVLTPVSLALIIDNFPPDKRSVGIGFWGFFVMVGPAMGPMIGGFLADYRWPWMFYINIPVAAFSAFTVWLFLKDKKEVLHKQPADRIGIVLLFTTVGAFQMAMNRWNIYDWFRSGIIIGLFVLGFFCLLVLIIWELFHPKPFLDISHFKRRNFALPSLTTGIGMGLLFSSFVLDSLWVQEVLGYTPAWAGLTLTPVGIFPLIFYPLVGRFLSLLDLRIWVIGSFLLYAITFFWLENITIYTPFWKLALPRLVQGIGFAFFTVPNAVMVVQGIAHESLTSVIALFSFTRMLFVGFAIAIAVTIWTVRETYYQTILTARTFFSNPLFENLSNLFAADKISESKSMACVYDIFQAEASTLALADIYHLWGWLFIFLCVLVLFFKKPA